MTVLTCHKSIGEAGGRANQPYLQQKPHSRPRGRVPNVSLQRWVSRRNVPDVGGADNDLMVQTAPSAGGKITLRTSYLQGPTPWPMQVLLVKGRGGMWNGGWVTDTNTHRPRTLCTFDPRQFDCITYSETQLPQDNMNTPTIPYYLIISSSQLV